MTTHIDARVIEYSVNADYPKLANRLVTFVLTYPRFIHAELMTHRDFSRNASSSRAIPIVKMLKQVWNDPAMPIHWGKNQPGMQAYSELPAWKKAIARFLWKLTGRAVCIPVWMLNKLGLAKQVGNRLLEPWQWIHVVLTASELENWFNLRDHEAAQPEIRQLAQAMRTALYTALYTGVPRTLSGTANAESAWHLPFIRLSERATYPVCDLRKMSAARCARVSYLTHEGREPDLSADLQLFDRLVGANPRHASPVEHQALVGALDQPSGNFRGFVQFRKMLEVEWAKEDMKNIF